MSIIVIVGCVLASLSHGLVAMPAEAIEIGSSRQLFVDDYIIESKHRSFRVLNQPVKHLGNPIIELTPVQKVGSKDLVIVSGSVFFDREEGLFKMWYEGADYEWSNNVVCYATSRDGINWELPKLGLYKYQGSTENNIVFRSSRRVGDVSPGVFKDPVARDPARKYKMIYKRGAKTTDGVRVAFSPDGIHWTDGADDPIIDVSDSPNSVMWDPRLGVYVAHTRHHAYYDGNYTREVLQSESHDFRSWRAYGVILKADQADPVRSKQFYNMEWMPYEEVYFGFISVYHTLPGMETKITPGLDWIDKVDIQLTFSRDGRNWQRAGDRQVFIPNGSGPEDFDRSMIFTMQHPIVVGDEIWIYYVGFSGRHWATNRKEPQGGKVGLAKLRKDGFISIDAGEGTLTTRSLKISGDQLVINADASLGSITVEILGQDGEPLPGFGLKDARPAIGDRVRHPIRWSGGPDLGHLKGKTVAFKFHIDRSKLFSFQLE